MTLNPINNNIIFSFVDPVNSKGEFEKGTTESGIILQSSFDDSAKSPRWGNVVSVGPACTVKVGQQILMPNLRWTSGFTHDGQRLWKTDETQIVATRDNESSKLHMLRNVVAFVQRTADSKMRTVGSLTVIGRNTDTPRGVVIVNGPDCPAELHRATIYYDDTNFTDMFSHGGFQLAFISDDNILAYTPHGESGEA